MSFLLETKIPFFTKISIEISFAFSMDRKSPTISVLSNFLIMRLGSRSLTGIYPLLLIRTFVDKFRTIPLKAFYGIGDDMVAFTPRDRILETLK